MRLASLILFGLFIGFIFGHAFYALTEMDDGEQLGLFGTIAIIGIPMAIGAMVALVAHTEMRVFDDDAEEGEIYFADLRAGEKIQMLKGEDGQALKSKEREKFTAS